jgi:guanylate kinase
MDHPVAFRRRGIIFIVSAPSGAGKTTLSRRAVEAFPDLSLSVSYTTRTPRANEVNGQDYHFIAEEQFFRLRDSGALVEWARVHGFFYGTPRAPLQEALAAGRDILLDIDVQGARQIKQAHPEAVSVFILPPSWEELEKRLRGRRTEAEEVIARRLKRAYEEAEERFLYDYWIINDKLERAVATLKAIIIAERARVSRMVQE